MKVAIIVFSPSGNTMKVGKMLRNNLLEKHVEVQLINIARSREIFVERNIEQYFKKTIEAHDVFCVGGPVYAHHLHYNVQDLIKSLPRPGNGWGKLAVPFVTYGGVNSGIAIQEAAHLLKKSGRIVVAGMKINAFHCISKLKQITIKVNPGMPGDEALATIEDLTQRIIELENVRPEECADVSGDLGYQSPKVKIKAHTIFRENIWQRHLYPRLLRLLFNNDKCTACGTCAKVCPIQRIEMNGNGPTISKGTSECIHCIQCTVNCPTGAIELEADFEKLNKLLREAVAGRSSLSSNEVPKSAVYPIRTY